jgi:hypothetical protein
MKIMGIRSRVNACPEQGRRGLLQKAESRNVRARTFVGAPSGASDTRNVTNRSAVTSCPVKGRMRLLQKAESRNVHARTHVGAPSGASDTGNVGQRSPVNACPEQGRGLMQEAVSCVPHPSFGVPS